MSVLLGAAASPIYQPTTTPNSGGIIDFSTGKSGGVVVTAPPTEGQSDERGSKVDTPKPAESYSTGGNSPAVDNRTPEQLAAEAEAKRKKQIMMYAAVGVGALLLFWYMRKK